jgi:iron-sulfur cluster insertion protein
MLSLMTESSPPLWFTDEAIARIRFLRDKNGAVSQKLRIAVSGGGCSGFRYLFSFEDAAAEDDIQMEQDGIEVLIDATSMQYLNGAEIGYEGSEGAAHFVIANVTAPTCSGCSGSSCD